MSRRANADACPKVCYAGFVLFLIPQAVSRRFSSANACVLALVKGRGRIIAGGCSECWPLETLELSLTDLRFPKILRH